MITPGTLAPLPLGRAKPVRDIYSTGSVYDDMKVSHMERQGPDSITLTYDFPKWSIPALKKFPREQRFLLGNRTEGHLLNVFEGPFCEYQPLL